MTEVEKLDAEIVKAAVGVVDKWRTLGISSVPEDWIECRALESAVAAKRAAMQPTLLDCEDASRIYKDHCSNSSAESMDAVLTACLERAYKVIEALPRKFFDGGEGVGQAEYVALHHVASALLDGRSA